jgi:phytoene dehydrogenase-like protein
MNPLGNLYNYDAIIIGAGHNGLVTATYLAKAGRRVLVCEKNDHVGGAAITQELFPGFRFSTVADGSGYLSQEVASDLKLEAHGLEILSSDSVVFSPQPDGSQLTIWRDTVRTCNEIAQFSAADAEAYPKFVELMSKIAGVVAGLCRVLPPDVPDFSWADLRSIPKLAGPIRRLGRKNINHLLRVLPMPITDLLNEWFESEPVKGAIAASAVRDISYGPYEAGTAYTFLYNWGLGDTGLFRSAGIIKGGMGKLTETMADAARSFGAEIRTSTAVESVILEEDRFSGVKLAGGEVVNAKIGVSNAAPRTTFVDLVDPGVLKANFVRHLRNIKYRGSGARIHLALRDLPEFTALGSGDTAAVLRGPIQIAPTMKYLQQAYNCVKYGQFSPRPYLDITIPSLLDPSLAPEGQHVMSITAKYAPNDLRVGQWDASREPFTEAVLDTLAEYAPNIRDLILHKRTLVPPDLEAEFGLPEGNPNHGEMTLDQFFHMRPIPGYARYRTPVEGMYLCGAGAHPGGGVTGIPGQNAAREILRGASFRPHSQSTGPE